MTGAAKSPIGRLVQRHAEQAIMEALQDTRVVLVNGARQSGKSTLLRQVARADAAEWRDLDSPVIRQAALADPAGFVDYPDMMVIDEIQRAPELLLCLSLCRYWNRPGEQVYDLLQRLADLADLGQEVVPCFRC